MKIKIVETRTEKQHAFNVRHDVFVNEQNVPANIEVDAHDETAVHFLVYTADHQPIAASRVRFTGQMGKLERICVLKEHRGVAIGSDLIEKMEETIRSNGYDRAKLHSQTHATAFYERLGYSITSDPFMDAGISHVVMEKEL